MRVFKYWRFRRTTLISCGLGALLVGLFMAYYGVKPEFYWFGLVPVLGIFTFKRKLAALLSVIILAAMLGVWRGSVVFQKVESYKKLYDKSVVAYGTVVDDPGYNEERSQTEFNVNNLVINSLRLPGRVQVSTRDTVMLGRGDSLKIIGKLSASKGTSRQAYLSSAKVTLLKENNSWLEAVRGRFFAAIHNSLPEPQASLGLGYLVGLRVNIPKKLSDQLAIVGLTHIIAVSGYNLTIIVQAVRRLLGKKSAYQSVVISGALIIGFLAVAGGSAPINRAVIVSVFSLLAWYYGREFKPLLLLLLSGAITAFVSPLYIWGDPGWYLSFLAFGGVLLLAPLVTKRIYKAKTPGVVIQILIETMSAQLCTIPYTLYLFDGVSVIAPLANVLILPFIPFIMFIVFVMGLIGMAFGGLAVWIGVIPGALLTLQMWLIEHLSLVSLAHADIKITILMMLLMFSLVVALVLYLNRSVASFERQELASESTNLIQ